MWLMWQAAAPTPVRCGSAGELRQCELLEELTLQHNRLASVLLSFASLRSLRWASPARREAPCLCACHM
jgi:hypothetical protein